MQKMLLAALAATTLGSTTLAKAETYDVNALNAIWAEAINIANETAAGKLVTPVIARNDDIITVYLIISPNCWQKTQSLEGVAIRTDSGSVGVQPVITKMRFTQLTGVAAENIMMMGFTLNGCRL